MCMRSQSSELLLVLDLQFRNEHVYTVRHSLFDTDGQQLV